MKPTLLLLSVIAIALISGTEATGPAWRRKFFSKFCAARYIKNSPKWNGCVKCGVDGTTPCNQWFRRRLEEMEDEEVGGCWTYDPINGQTKLGLTWKCGQVWDEDEDEFDEDAFDEDTITPLYDQMETDCNWLCRKRKREERLYKNCMLSPVGKLNFPCHSVFT